MALVLRGYGPSVYTRIVRLVLAEKRIACEYLETDPFVVNPDPCLLQENPFGRVPVLAHDGFVLFETCAITGYLDVAFPGPRLTPTDPRAVARMAQIVAIIDAHGYWPLVRQVFVQAVPRRSEMDEKELNKGLRGSAEVLNALDAIACEGLQLNRVAISLADLHLAPMMDYFQRAPEGADMLSRHASLTAWWHWIRNRPSVRATDPGPNPDT